MIRGVCSGFGNVFTAEMARTAREHHLQEIRFDVLQSGEQQGPDDLMPLDIVRESLHICQEEGLTAVCLLSGKLKAHRMTAEKCVQRRDEIESLGFPLELFWHEVGSEGNDPGWPYAPAELAGMVAAVKEGSPRRVTALFSNNTGRNGLAYTKLCLDTGVVIDALGIHPYRTTQEPEDGCPDGWSTREEEWRVIRTLQREYCVRHGVEAPFELHATEVGWHSRASYRGKGIFKRKIAHFDEQKKAAFYPREMGILKANGVTRCHWFQWSNGPDTDQHHEAGYGLFGPDGQPLPLADAVRAYGEQEGA